MTCISGDLFGFLCATGVIAAGCLALWLTMRDLLKY